LRGLVVEVKIILKRNLFKKKYGRMTSAGCTTLVLVFSDRPDFLAGLATAGFSGTLLFCGLFLFGLLF